MFLTNVIALIVLAFSVIIESEQLQAYPNRDHIVTALRCADIVHRFHEVEQASEDGVSDQLVQRLREALDGVCECSQRTCLCTIDQTLPLIDELIVDSIADVRRVYETLLSCVQSDLLSDEQQAFMHAVQRAACDVFGSKYELVLDMHKKCTRLLADMQVVAYTGALSSLPIPDKIDFYELRELSPAGDNERPIKRRKLDDGGFARPVICESVVPQKGLDLMKSCARCIDSFYRTNRDYRSRGKEEQSKAGLFKALVMRLTEACNCKYERFCCACEIASGKQDLLEQNIALVKHAAALLKKYFRGNGTFDKSTQKALNCLCDGINAVSTKDRFISKCNYVGSHAEKLIRAYRQLCAAQLEPDA